MSPDLPRTGFQRQVEWSILPVPFPPKVGSEAPGFRDVETEPHEETGPFETVDIRLEAGRGANFHDSV